MHDRGIVFNGFELEEHDRCRFTLGVEPARPVGVTELVNEEPKVDLNGFA